MKVKNVNGSSRWAAPKGYISWLDYWSAHKGLIIDCCALDCKEKGDLVGAHVQKVNSTDKGIYIIPLCRACNQRTDEFEVTTSLLLPVPSRLEE